MAIKRRIFHSERSRTRNRRKFKMSQISGPCIVLMLKSQDIIDDWNVIMESMNQFIHKNFVCLCLFWFWIWSTNVYFNLQTGGASHKKMHVLYFYVAILSSFPFIDILIEDHPVNLIAEQIALSDELIRYVILNGVPSMQNWIFFLLLK